MECFHENDQRHHSGASYRRWPELGLVGLFQFDLVAALFGGQDALLSRVVYTLVGISALRQLVPLFRNNHDTAEHHTSPHVRNNP